MTRKYLNSIFSPFLALILLYNFFMGKEEILSYLKYAKIQNETLKKICYYFVEDYTAIQTAQELNLSRQTINNYYKIIRTLILFKQEELVSFMSENRLCNDSFSIKYIKLGKNISYFIECNKKVFVIDSKENFLPKINEFIEEELEESLLNNKRTNCAKVLFNHKEKNYMITKVYKSSNLMQEFIDKRVKKFRGVNKQNLQLHIKESQFRYNYSTDYIYETLLSMLNLNNKTSTI